jgi:hypothetical protein
MPSSARFGRWRTRPLRVLDFDIENRPLAYWYGDATTAEITAIAWSWYGDDEVHVRYLDPVPYHETSAVGMLEAFRRAYDKADMVTGHSIRRHDLPIVNSALVEYGLQTLSPKLVSDTHLDLIRYGQQSKSQASLSNVLGTKAEKPAMSTVRWRDANRLTPDGITATIERVVGDVKQHKELRLALIERGLLKPPRTWTP